MACNFLQHRPTRIPIQQILSIERWSSVKTSRSPISCHISHTIRMTSSIFNPRLLDGISSDVRSQFHCILSILPTAAVSSCELWPTPDIFHFLLYPKKKGSLSVTASFHSSALTARFRSGAWNVLSLWSILLTEILEYPITVNLSKIHAELSCKKFFALHERVFSHFLHWEQWLKLHSVRCCR